ncbi:kinase-like domain-containing protein [Radiomyces spectabilis]|uniref:kinase-like domain-containing protein n=1 Tax=Radiomyces spectabilis TaxID=64574 RepID=UPI00221FE438|nr:kinase-like domain-containing protein [Radiomyces spectabilis]KAI8379290.1 kinase-like domain-containing protein [Radiomyces spectabilis]
MTRWFNDVFQFHNPWRHSKRRSAKYHEKPYVGKYKILYDLGYGSSGIVYMAMDPKTHHRYAIKELSKSRIHLQSRSLDLFYPHRKLEATEQPSFHQERSAPCKRRQVFKDSSCNEAALMQQLHHPNIVRLVECINEPQIDKFYLVMEMVSGATVMDIQPFTVIKTYDDSNCRMIFRQLVAAVEYLHSQNILHGDIKPQNILLTKEHQVKLIDFGSAISLDTMSSSFFKGNYTGTPAFMAPELLRKGKHDPDTSIDIWSLGITLFCLHEGYLPFESPNILQLYEKIRSSRAPRLTKESPELQDLLDGLLCNDPEKRLTMPEIKNHPWYLRDT